MISRAFCLIGILKIAVTFRIGAPSNRIVDHFTYTPSSGNDMENENEDAQWEFLVIGGRVPWNEALAICPIYGHLNPLSVLEEAEMGYNGLPDSLKREPETDTESTLAVLDNDMMDWLARMVSESNYRYDGLWVGGQRKNSASNWTWIDTRRKGNMLISRSVLIRDHPSWNTANDDRSGERNCLAFDKSGHDASALVAENCRRRKPFLCMRVGKKKSKAEITQSSSVLIDGQRYTLYKIHDDENEEMLKAKGVQKINGGGVTWKEARLQCEERGKLLAMVFSNEAATIIANAMLKSRPSMESAWLDGRSANGADWKWVSSGFTLSSTKSNITSYPPWADNHPILPMMKNNDLYQEGRCLILDRHFCPEHTNPVFLDLDCGKRRPFVCQDAMLEDSMDNDIEILIGDKRLILSFAKMTWDEGEVYCQKKSGHIASIWDSKTLSAVLEKMMELALDHLWIGGRTIMTKDGWKWVDENGENLSKNDLGTADSWCLDKDNDSWPYTDRESCLNLDREDYNTPLFYGLPCNTTSQHVLCNLSAKDMLAFVELHESDIDENIVAHHEIPEDDSNKSNDTLDIGQQATDLAERIRQLAKNGQSALLFVMDDSLSILNVWFAEEMKLAATIIRRYFPLSQDHPMGMITFSQKSKLVLALNQTDICSVLTMLSQEMLANRATRITKDLEGVAGKTTDLINAASMSADIVRASNMQRVIIIFVTDGEHETEDGDTKDLHTAAESLQNLRNKGHEAFAIVTSQGQKHADYNVIMELFSKSPKGEQNLYFVKNYQGLEKMNSALNTTGWKEDYAARCGVIEWNVPKDDEFLVHLLQSEK